MFAPLIGITTSVTVDKSPERAYVNIAYVRAVQDAGGIPLLLPPHLTADVQAALWQRLDGLVLTGGGDIDPAHFGQARHAKTDDVAPARDELELSLTRRALDEEVPLFAICRGIQVLNVALGGTLVQDLPSGRPSSIAHSQREPRHEPTHVVKVMGEGVIEGVELPGGDDHFVLGVQWHPEELVGHDQAARNLFTALVEAARRHPR